MCIDKNTIKNTKSQSKETVREIVNFGSIKLTESKKHSRNTNIMVQNFSNAFIILLYFILTRKELTL